MYVYVCALRCVALARSKQEQDQRTTHTHLPMNYICGHIYQDFTVTAFYSIVFWRFNNS